MRYIKVGIIVIFIAVTIVFAVNLNKDRKSADNTMPVIEISSEQLDVSVKAKKEDLLKGVIAKDEKDGDITNKIVIENISKFVDKKKHICNITYAVADSDKNVVKKTRKMRFTDYEAPKFTLSKPLSFNVGEEMKVADVIGAKDDFDGDISDRVKILSNSVTMSMAGEYTVTAQVTNSLGDTVKLRTIAVINLRNNLSPVIQLKDNLVYLKKGAKFDADKYIKSVKDYKGNIMSNDSVSVTSSSVNMKKVGCYNVEYTAEDKDKHEGKIYLTVVVED